MKSIKTWEERPEFLSIASLFKGHENWGWAEAEAESQEHNAGLTFGWQQHIAQAVDAASRLCIGRKLASEVGLGLGPWHSGVGVSSSALNTVPNTHPPFGF